MRKGNVKMKNNKGDFFLKGSRYLPVGKFGDFNVALVCSGGADAIPCVRLMKADTDTDAVSFVTRVKLETAEYYSKDEIRLTERDRILFADFMNDVSDKAKSYRGRYWCSSWEYCVNLWNMQLFSEREVSGNVVAPDYMTLEPEEDEQTIADGRLPELCVFALLIALEFQ
jgi:hypothetical protein